MIYTFTIEIQDIALNDDFYAVAKFWHREDNSLNFQEYGYGNSHLEAGQNALADAWNKAKERKII